MSVLYYAWGWDVAAGMLLYDGFYGQNPSAVASLSCTVDDGTDSGTAEITSGSYSHIDMSTRLGTAGEYTAFSTALDTEITTVLATNGVTVTFSYLTGYTLTFGATSTIDFTSGTLGDSTGKMLAAILGFNYQHPDATGGASSDPYNVSLSGASSYTSNCRPYYFLLPTITGRSQVTEDYEEDGAVNEAVADDGTAYHVAKDGVGVWYDWVQMAERNDPDTAFTAFGAGAPVHKIWATRAVPWTYQHAWEHARTGGSHPFFVVDDVIAYDVHALRADGLSFRPSRFASQDYDLWNVPFRTRMLGR